MAFVCTALSQDTATTCKCESKYSGLLHRLAKAGWEPITGPRASPKEVRLERFDQDSEIYLMAHNPEVTDVIATIELELKTLGLTKFSISSVLGERPGHQSDTRLQLYLPAKGTSVLVIQKGG